METKSLNVDVCVRKIARECRQEFLNSVTISIVRDFEELYKNNIKILLQLQNFESNYVYDLLQDKLHDHVLSEQICNQIFYEAGEETRNLSIDCPFLMIVYVRLTQKLVPSSSTSDLEKKKEKEEEEEKEELETCSICLEKLSESGSEVKPIWNMTNCSHMFHEDCVFKWLNRPKNTCPLCRQPVF